jgi:hypothetical protein
MAKGCAVAIVLDDVEQREIGDDEIARTIRKTSETRPKGGNHWSLRSVAKEIDHAPSSVHRIWRASGLQPHRVETFKLSTDPLFVEKVRDIVGLYLSPPARPASPASNAFAYPSGEAFNYPHLVERAEGAQKPLQRRNRP